LAASALDAKAQLGALDELVDTLTRLTRLLDTDQPLTPGGHVDALKLADDALRIAEGLA
jgi:hypothetical protein